jgi:hypothetical protein
MSTSRSGCPLLKIHRQPQKITAGQGMQGWSSDLLHARLVSAGAAVAPIFFSAHVNSDTLTMT